MVSLHGFMTIGMSVVNLSWMELLLVRHVFAKLTGTLMMFPFLLTILWRRKQKV